MQKETILTKIMTTSTKVITANMYDNNSGIKFEEIYADYKYVSSTHHA